MLPSIQMLEAFEAAARHLSFQNAAVELNITPPAVSHRIKELERLCGRALFYRHTRRVELRASGNELLPKVRTLLDGMHTLVEGNGTRPLRLSVTPLFGTSFLLPRMAGFRRAFPDAPIKVQLAVKPGRRRHLDAEVRFGPTPSPGWRAERLLPVRLTPVCSSRFAGMDVESLVSRVPRIQYAYARHGWHGMLPDTARPSLPAVSVEEMGDAVTLARAGHGIAVVVEELVTRELAAGELIRIPGARSKRGCFHLAYRTETEALPVFQRFRSWLTDTCQEHAAPRRIRAAS